MDSFLLALFVCILYVPITIPSSLQTSPSKESTQKSSSSQKVSIPCRLTEAFSGEVKRGKDYDHVLSSGSSLTFHLRDVSMKGWQIEILPKEPSSDGKRRDWAWPLNPPYYGYNAQNVSVSYDFTARDVIEYGPREFRFPLNQADADRALGLYDRLQSRTGQQLDETMQDLENFPSGKGTFEIIDSQLSSSGPEDQQRGRIEWLRFKVTIALPCQPGTYKR
jgi:hypothetical protein